MRRRAAALYRAHPVEAARAFAGARSRLLGFGDDRTRKVRRTRGAVATDRASVDLPLQIVLQGSKWLILSGLQYMCMCGFCGEQVVSNIVPAYKGCAMRGACTSPDCSFCSKVSVVA